MANVLYEEECVQAIADALRLKHDGDTATYKISAMSAGALSLPFGNIPSYHYKEAGRVVKRLLELKSLYPNNIVLGTIADNHPDTGTASTLTSARHAVYALETVGSMVCDFVVNFGDNCSGTNIDNDADLANITYMENAARYVMKILITYNLVGNHCKSNDTQKIYNLIGKYNSFDDYGTTQIRGYGYKDYTDKKARIICLNTCDYWNTQGGNGMSYEQKDFLMRALDLSDKEDYKEWIIIILSHIPLDFLGGDYNKGADLKAILKAYNDGSSVSITVNSNYASAENETPSNYETYSNGALVYDYSGKNTPRIISFHAHIHNNKWRTKLIFIDDNTELNIPRIATPNSVFNGNCSTDRYTDYGDYSITTEEADKIKKVAGTKADTSATFYFIDLDGQIIYSVGYGADIDRVIPYKDAEVYTVSYNLTDVTSSNDTASVVEGEAYSTTLTVGAGYALDTVTVTMGGADITETVHSDGVITIAEVTGDIVITATAIDNYVPVWDIADRTAVDTWYLGASDEKSLSRKIYIVGAASTGLVDYRRVTGISLDGNDVTFTSDSKAVGIALPYHLEAGASYTFSCTASASARLRVYQYDADGVFVSGSESYSSSGTNLSLTFTAPTDESIWTMLLLDTNTVGTSITYTGITLTKN